MRVIKMFCVLVLGTACLMVVFVLLPGMLELDPTMIEGFSALAIVGVYLVAIAISGADAVTRLKDILKVRTGNDK